MYGYEEPVRCCDKCDTELYEEEYAYKVKGEILCEDCFEDYVNERYRVTIVRKNSFDEEDYR